jgi:PIN domain nuclease of toxin-antitoxin system
VRYLVDTHVFLWWMSDPCRLSSPVTALLRERPGEIAFSSVSVWEMAIKSSLAKVSGIPFHDLGAEIEALGWSELRFSIRHAAAVADLPFHHHDPFDRARSPSASSRISPS